MSDALRRWSHEPRQIFGLESHPIQPGAPADLVAFDAAETWTVDPDKFWSRGRHTPFTGTSLRGRVLATWIDGEPVYDVHEGIPMEANA